MSNALSPANISLTPPATRVSAPEYLTVCARTMGTREIFDIRVANLSRSGMLLECTKVKFKPPFRENTLLELELKTSIRGEPRRINCLAKVVRKSVDANAARYGIRMIHNDEQDHLDWLSMITALEKDASLAAD